MDISLDIEVESMHMCYLLINNTHSQKRLLSPVIGKPIVNTIRQGARRSCKLISISVASSN